MSSWFHSALSSLRFGQSKHKGPLDWSVRVRPETRLVPTTDLSVCLMPDVGRLNPTCTRDVGRVEALIEGLRPQASDTRSDDGAATDDSTYLSFTVRQTGCIANRTHTLRLPSTVAQQLGVDYNTADGNDPSINQTHLLGLTSETERYSTVPSKSLLIFTPGKQLANTETVSVLMALMVREPGAHTESSKYWSTHWTPDPMIKPVIVHISPEPGREFAAAFRVRRALVCTIDPTEGDKTRHGPRFWELHPVKTFERLLASRR